MGKMTTARNPIGGVGNFGVRWLDTAFFLSFCRGQQRKKAVSSHRTPKLRTVFLLPILKSGAVQATYLPMPNGSRNEMANRFIRAGSPEFGQSHRRRSHDRS